MLFTEKDKLNHIFYMYSDAFKCIALNVNSFHWNAQIYIFLYECRLIDEMNSFSQKNIFCIDDTSTWSFSDMFIQWHKRGR